MSLSWVSVFAVYLFFLQIRISERVASVDTSQQPSSPDQRTAVYRHVRTLATRRDNNKGHVQLSVAARWTGTCATQGLAATTQADPRTTFPPIIRFHGLRQAFHAFHFPAPLLLRRSNLTSLMAKRLLFQVGQT